jgi:hypothetical protein
MEGEVGGAYSMHGKDMRTERWFENLRVGNHLEEKVVHSRIILKWILNKQDGRALAAFIWIQIRTIFRLLQMAMNL